MKLNNMLTNLFYLLFFSSLLHLSFSSSFEDEDDDDYSSSLELTAFSSPSSKKFDVVTQFGAKNDGNTDATKAFLNAWVAACASPTPSQLNVPKGNYLLKSIIFDGTGCKSSISFIIDGTLIAGNDYNQHWISFRHVVSGLNIKGGVLDAKGKKLWDCKVAGRGCPTGAQSLSFDHCENIRIEDLTSKDSQMFHMALNYCQNINMKGVTVTAPKDSPNTDGIHIERSKGITITNSQFKTGDDCISIGPDNQNLWIESIYCGPGHGISIGSLGRGTDEGVLVQNVTVKSSTFKGTGNGLRIKTFSTPIKGDVKDIYFLGATMINVQNPIIIDQNYCPHNNCNKGQGSGIKISNVVYKNIQGASLTPKIINFDCSPTTPCSGLKLQNVKLDYQSGTPKCEYKNARLMSTDSMRLNCQLYSP
ncbi:hypothetical protein RND81_04G229900 [Saponaria officinalis]|uniref:Polygalacturonase n=1 Tax=Saponaria officinalis TaxID=3572 RepID=A0AAW1LP49_SAPOF